MNGCVDVDLGVGVWRICGYECGYVGMDMYGDDVWGCVRIGVWTGVCMMCAVYEWTCGCGCGCCCGCWCVNMWV